MKMDIRKKPIVVVRCHWCGSRHYIPEEKGLTVRQRIEKWREASGVKAINGWQWCGECQGPRIMEKFWNPKRKSDDEIPRFEIK